MVDGEEGVWGKQQFEVEVEVEAALKFAMALKG